LKTQSAHIQYYYNTVGFTCLVYMFSVISLWKIWKKIFFYCNLLFW